MRSHLIFDVVSFVTWALLSCFLVSIPSTNANLNCTLVESQRIAIKNFYLSLNGNHWVYPQYIPGKAWNVSALDYNPCNHWKGINCSVCLQQGGQSIITHLNLTRFELKGSLQNSILLNLTTLLSFDIDSNSVSGTIPLAFQNFSFLTILSMNDNLLTGEISPNLFPSNSLLTGIFISGNKLKGSLASSIFQISGLKYFYSSNNHLIGTIPTEIGLATALQNFYVNINQLTGPIPTELGLLSNLGYSSMTTNYLSGRLDFLAGLKALVYLGLRQNRIYGSIPESIGNCSLLSIIRLDNNQLTGSLPSSISQLRYLRGITASSNYLNGTIDVFASPLLTNLSSIYIDNNAFSGTIPSNLFFLPSLQLLSLSQNCFHGSIPDAVCAARKLTSVQFDGLSSGYTCRKYLLLGLAAAYVPFDFIEGTIPSCLLSLPNISDLHIAGNGIQSQLPSSIGNSLQHLSASYNQFYGTIPIALQELPIPYRDLSYNEFKGTLAAMSDLPPKPVTDNYTLYLQVNRLSGEIPRSFHDTFESIQILSGNLFQCSSSTLPEKDPQFLSYICGSNQLNESEYAFFSVFGAVLLAIFITKLYRSYIYYGKNTLSNQLSIDSTFAVRSSDSMGSDIVSAQEIVAPGPRAPFADDLISAAQIRGRIKDPAVTVTKTSAPSLLLPASAAEKSSETIPAIVPSPKDIRLSSVTASAADKDNDESRNSFTRGSSFALNAYEHAKITSSMSQLDHSGNMSFGREQSYESNVSEFYDNLNLYFHQFLESAIFACTGYRMFTKEILNMPKLFRYVKLMHQFRLIFVVIFVVNVFLILPLFLFFSSYQGYSSHTYKYRWSATAAFARGYLPAVLFMIIWLVIAILSVWRIITIKILLKRDEKTIGISKQSASSKKEKSEQYLDYVQKKRKYKESRTWSNYLALGHSHKVFLLCWLVALFNIACMVGLNVLYILGEVSHLSLYAKFFLQLGTAVVKFVWNVFALRGLIGLITKFKGDPTDKKVNLYIGLMAFNNIAAPIVATLFTDSRCLRTVFFPDSPIVSTFDVISCGESLIFEPPDNYVASCALQTTSTITFSFDPPFIYSYQCGSAIVTNYVPMFNYSYTLFMLWPLLQILLTRLDYRYIPKFFLYWLPGEIWPHADYTLFKRIMHPDLEIIQQLIHLFLLLTFGVTSVQLAIAICSSALTSSIVSQILVVRFICKRSIAARRTSKFESVNPILAMGADDVRLSRLSNRESNASIRDSTLTDFRDSTLSQASMANHFRDDISDVDSPHSPNQNQTSSLGLLENACSGSWRRLLNGSKLVFAGAACFYACILYDIVADDNEGGPLDGVWLPIVCVLTPITFMIIRYGCVKTKNSRPLSEWLHSMRLNRSHQSKEMSHEDSAHADEDSNGSKTARTGVLDESDSGSSDSGIDDYPDAQEDTKAANPHIRVPPRPKVADLSSLRYNRPVSQRVQSPSIVGIEMKPTAAL